ncbi:MAG TPA: serine hydrolase [Bacteroidales bacterium]|nr:serine hydrolase [Bacteroidales bacterium]
MKNRFLTQAFLMIFAGLLAFAPGIHAQKDNLNKQLSTLDDYYAKARVDWEVPALAVAIVKNGQIVFEKGYGQRDINSGGTTDQNTMFAVASNTKAFTAAALAILVDEGLIHWDDPVTEYLPWFRMYDPYVTAHMTIRDLLTHRSGLATFSGDLIWYGSTYSRREVIERARFLKPMYGFRENFGYSNIMYIAAGEIIPAVTGKSWDDFIREHFFEPLHMTRSITSTTQLDKFENVATPHTDFNDEVVTIEYLNWDNVAAAGAIISSVHDMSQWLMLQLNHGIVKDDTIFSPARSREMWSQNTVQNVSGFSEKTWPTTFFKSYGLGWGLNNYLGHKIVSHSGGYDGMISYTCLVPDENLGFVILTNKNSSLYYPLIYQTLDVMLGGIDKDWSAFILDRNRPHKDEPARKKEPTPAEKYDNTSPSVPLQEYTGTYSGQLYGDANVYLRDDTLMVQLVPSPLFLGTLRHLYFDTFEITFTNLPSLPKGTVQFVQDAQANIHEMKIDVPNPDFDFTELEFIKGRL